MCILCLYVMCECTLVLAFLCMSLHVFVNVHVEGAVDRFPSPGS